MHDALAGGHPLQVSVAVPPGVAHRVGVVDDPLEGGGERLKASVGVLREAGDAVAVVHPVGGGGSEVGSVASPGGPHELVPRGVEVLVVDAEEEGVERPEGEAQTLHAQDETLHLREVGVVANR